MSFENMERMAEDEDVAHELQDEYQDDQTVRDGSHDFALGVDNQPSTFINNFEHEDVSISLDDTELALLRASQFPHDVTEPYKDSDLHPWTDDNCKLNMSPAQAYHYRRRVTRKPYVDPDNDNTIQEVLGQREKWTKSLMRAVLNVDDVFDKVESTAFKKINELSKHKVEAACHILFDTIIDRCLHGYRGDPEKDKARPNKAAYLKNPVDTELKCADRIKAAVDTLTKYKSVSVSMVDEGTFDTIANHPHALRKEKAIGRKSNDTKKAPSDKNKMHGEFVAKQDLELGDLVAKDADGKLVPLDRYAARKTKGIKRKGLSSTSGLQPEPAIPTETVDSFSTPTTKSNAPVQVTPATNSAHGHMTFWKPHCAKTPGNQENSPHPSTAPILASLITPSNARVNVPSPPPASSPTTIGPLQPFVHPLWRVYFPDSHGPYLPVATEPHNQTGVEQSVPHYPPHGSNRGPQHHEHNQHRVGPRNHGARKHATQPDGPHAQPAAAAPSGLYRRKRLGSLSRDSHATDHASASKSKKARTRNLALADHDREDISTDLSVPLGEDALPRRTSQDYELSFTGGAGAVPRKDGGFDREYSGTLEGGVGGEFTGKSAGWQDEDDSQLPKN
ncbi:hypothetical protein PMIN06_010090 [Paraphaeosphaeria minitans]